MSGSLIRGLAWYLAGLGLSSVAAYKPLKSYLERIQHEVESLVREGEALAREAKAQASPSTERGV